MGKRNRAGNGPNAGQINGHIAGDSRSSFTRGPESSLSGSAGLCLLPHALNLSLSNLNPNWTALNRLISESLKSLSSSSTDYRSTNSKVRVFAFLICSRLLNFWKLKAMFDNAISGLIARSVSGLIAWSVSGLQFLGPPHLCSSSKYKWVEEQGPTTISGLSICSCSCSIWLKLFYF